MYYSEIHNTQEKRLLFAMMLSGILPLLDSSIVNVILPDISDSIGASYSHMHWVVIAYMLAGSGGILLSPFASRKYGTKTTWVYSLLLFLIGSVLVGLSFNTISIIVSRCLQGIGAGILMPVTQSALALQFTKERFRSVMALIAIPAVFAPAAGPLLGVTLADIISWRFAFFINIPVVLLALFAGMKVIPQTDRSDIKFNFIVFSGFFISLVVIFLSIDSFISAMDSNSYHPGILASGIILLIASVTLNNKSKYKIMNFNQFIIPEYSFSVIVCFFTSVIFFSFLIFFPLLSAMQDNRSLLFIGFLLALQGAGAWIARKYIHQKCNSYSPFLIAGGGIIVSALSLLFIEHGGRIFESVGFFVRGAGLGIATIVTLSAPFEFGQKKYACDTSAITRVIQQTGGAFGGLMSGIVIHCAGEKLITVSDAYHLFFCFSLVTGIAVLCLVCCFRKSRK